jgi:hypothetical protein
MHCINDVTLAKILPSIDGIFHGIPWKNIMKKIFSHGIPWKIPWNSMEFNGIPWKSMEFNGIPWNSMEFHCIFHGSPWNYETEVDGIPWNSVN